MKTTNIGIILLTLLVLTKYAISVNTSTSADGSFKSGLVVDYTSIPDIISDLGNSGEPDLLAFNFSHSMPSDNPALKTNHLTPEKSSRHQTENQTTSSFAVFENTTPETLPMEHVNSLVVYNPSNPVIADMKTIYEDQYDQAAPLDNGNTLNNEMMMMMPRR